MCLAQNSARVEQVCKLSLDRSLNYLFIEFVVIIWVDESHTHMYDVQYSSLDFSSTTFELIGPMFHRSIE